MDVIDLGIGDPDLPTPAAVVERARDSARKPEYHRYPAYAGLPAMRRKVAAFYAAASASSSIRSARCWC